MPDHLRMVVSHSLMDSLAQLPAAAGCQPAGTAQAQHQKAQQEVQAALQAAAAIAWTPQLLQVRLSPAVELSCS